MLHLPELWFGDTATFLQLEKAVEFALANPAYFKTEMRDTEDDTRSWEERFLDRASDAIIQIAGRVGIVRIEGPLVDENSFYNLIFGLTSYDTISLALQKVMMNPQLEYAVMSMATGGGSAAGIDNLTENIRVLKTASDVKLLTHVQSAALSAGIWIGAMGDVVYASKMATVGSIGVLITHTSVAERLKQQGIDVTVITAGKDKGLGHPAVPLSDRAKKKLEQDAVKMYGFFLDHVSAERQLSRDTAGVWADGQTFFAEEARNVGLVDFIMSSQVLLDELNDGYEEPTGNDTQRNNSYTIYRGQAAA